MKNRSALQFVVIIGIVNFFADFTYEGARGIVGPFLGSLGASAAIVGFVAGFGELLGYGLRSFSGYLADKSHRHWAFAFVGYAINMLAVPALALTGGWPSAAGLVVAERVGRGIRKPTVEAMLSYAGKSIGAGWVFGLNEALDQAGATIGPLLMALILYLNRGFRTGFAVLLIPALCCLAILVVARLLHPRPHELEEGAAHALVTKNLTRAYWIYLAAGALIAAGVCRFRADWFSFSQSQYCFGGANSRVLCSGDGEQRTRFDSTRSFVRQVRPQYFVVRVCDFGCSCASCFSRPNRFRADWDDLLGDRNERTGISLSSGAHRRYSAAKTKHGVRLVRHGIRNRVVRWQRRDGIALRQIRCGRSDLFDGSAACRDSCYFYRKQAALNFHGSVRKTKRAKHWRAPAQDPARVAVCGTANTARTSGGEARRSR